MSKPEPSDAIAIIGLGCMFPKANDPNQYWANISNCIDGISDVPETHWPSDDYYDADPSAPDMTYAKRGGFLEPVDFDPMAYGIAPRDLEATDTTQLLGLVAAHRALADAGYADKEFDRSRTSVIMGVTGTLELVIGLGARLGHPIWRKALREAGVDAATADDVVARIGDGYPEWQENSFPGLLGNVAAGRIANRLNLGGTNSVVDAACASSLAALHLACMELVTGRTDMVVSGGLDTFNDIFMYMCFSKTPALSKTGNAKPFSADADGTILGEGLGVVILKRLADAERDGDRVYAVIRSIGTSSDGKGDAIYAPKASGQVQALRRAYEEAGVTPDSIELVEAHGTGTAVGDKTEAQALIEVYGTAERQSSWCALGSVKSQIGHTKAAAGVAGIIKATLALYHKVLPPTIKVETPAAHLAPGMSPFYVNTAKRPWLPPADHPRRAAVSAFGFGGSNFHCVLEEHSAEKPMGDITGDVQILAFTAADVESLRREIGRFAFDVPWSELRRQAAALRQAFDPAAPCRLLIVTERSKGNLSEQIRQALKRLEHHPNLATWLTPDHAYFSTQPKAGKLAFVFPGQGAQYPGMLRDLACEFPQMLAALAAGNDAFAGDTRLSDRIYPLPTYGDAAAAKAADEALRATNVAQPALGAVSLGLFAILRDFGVTPDAVAGHSFGELTALCAADRLSPAGLHALANVRGRLMAAAGTGDGAMLAVKTDADTAAQVIAAHKLDLVIANKNAPAQTVLSGSCELIERATAIFAEHEIAARPLNVAAAFHSPAMKAAHGPFFEALEQIDFAKGSTPVYANSTAALYPTTAKAARKLLADQLLDSVDFIGEIRAMQADGIDTFVEVGPSRQLTGLISAILADAPVHIFAADQSLGRHSAVLDLACTLARLAALGHTVDLAKWDPALQPAETARKPKFTVPINGANYRNQRPTRPPVSRPATIAAPGSSPAAAVAAAAPVSAGRTVELQSALQQVQQNMAALQQLQAETARLHSQFLHGQQQAQQVLQSLLAQQQHLFGGAAPAMPLYTPAPIAPGLSAPTAIQPPPAVLAPVAVPAPAAAVAVAPQPPAVADKIASTLLAVVSDKTGYPVDMLELGMGLDADLGIDSIKRVEILAALHAALPESPVIGPEHVGSLQTLGQIVDFLVAGTRSAVAAAPISAPVAAPRAATGGDFSRIASTLLAVVSDKTGYPVDMLELSMGLDADLGIDSIKRVEILASLHAALPESPVIGPEHVGTLQTLGQIVDFLAAGSAAAAPVASAAAVAAPTVGAATIAATLLAVVSDKTGYPVDMLELEMGLDADLGIDSIKRVEILAALHAALPESPVIGPEHVGTLQTLGQIVGFLAAGSTAALAPASAAAPTAGSSLDRATIASTLLAVVSDKTGYPADMLELDMGLDADLGIDSIKRVEILAALHAALPESPVIGPEHVGTLQTLSQIADFLLAGSSAAAAAPVQVVSAPAVAAAPPQLQKHGLRPHLLGDRNGEAKLRLGQDSTVWITQDHSGLADLLQAHLIAAGLQAVCLEPAEWHDITPPENLAGLIVLAPPAVIPNHFLRQAFLLIQRVGPILRRNAGKNDTLLATLSRLDGQFGLANLRDANPVSGGLAGLSKTAGHEWPEVHCKALDMEADVNGSLASYSQALVDELLHVGPVEVGIGNAGRHTLQLVPMPLSAQPVADRFSADDVILISGGARGVTAATAIALAETWQPTLVLLGRTPEPEAEAAFLAGAHSEAEIRQAILANSKSKLTPRELQEAGAKVAADREIRATLARIAAAGSRVFYRSGDVRDETAMRALVSEIRQQAGPITGLLHGAGVLTDKLIADKTAEQFDLVYSTKVTGLQALLAALTAEPLKVIGLFSSTTGRYGRVGQVDYAAANEVLNKIAHQQTQQRPDCKVIAFNWGPWDGGMVTPALKKMFSDEGIGVIPIRQGADFLVAEFGNGSVSSTEMIVLGGDSMLPPSNDRKVGTDADYRVAMTQELSVAALPILSSHVIEGQAVLPLALMLEWFGHAAIHENPGLQLKAVRDLRVHKRLAVAAGESRTIAVAISAGGEHHGNLSLRARLQAEAAGKTVVYAEATIDLAAKLPSGTPALTVKPLQPYPRPAEIYSTDRLFHGPQLHALQSITGISSTQITADNTAAVPPSAWIANPLRRQWLTDPLVIDGALQLLILWSVETNGVHVLPIGIQAYEQFQRKFPRDQVRTVVDVVENGHVITANVEFIAQDGSLIARMRGVQSVRSAALAAAFKANKLEQKLAQTT